MVTRACAVGILGVALSIGMLSHPAEISAQTVSEARAAAPVLMRVGKYVLETLRVSAEAIEIMKILPIPHPAEHAPSGGVAYPTPPGALLRYNPEDLNAAGVCYATGRCNGVAIDYVRARYLFQQAASLGNSRAKNNLGVLCVLGFGGTSDDWKCALDAWSDARAARDGVAMSNLGQAEWQRGHTLSATDDFLLALDYGYFNARPSASIACKKLQYEYTKNVLFPSVSESPGAGNLVFQSTMNTFMKRALDKCVRNGIDVF